MLFVTIGGRRGFACLGRHAAPGTFRTRCSATTLFVYSANVCPGVSQDPVFHTAPTVCDTTGTGCAVEAKPAKGSGVGWLTN